MSYRYGRRYSSYDPDSVVCTECDRRCYHEDAIACEACERQICSEPHNRECASRVMKTCESCDKMFCADCLEDPGCGCGAPICSGCGARHLKECTSSSSGTARRYHLAVQAVKEKRTKIDAVKREIANQKKSLRLLKESLEKDLAAAQNAKKDLERGDKENDGAINTPRGSSDRHSFSPRAINTPRGSSDRPSFSAGAKKRLEAAGLVQPQSQYRKRLV